MTTLEAVRLYSVAAAAELLSMSTDWVYARIKDGTFAVTELGSERSKQRIRADVLQAFIEARTFGRPTVSAGPLVELPLAPSGSADHTK